ncbi:MAG: sigma-54-dependent Fis family transcriptional regulator [Calditrichaeota bacterium]|nr:sigma-54-dependent Fis family transcriptional regulator [Calditrichota bacterium]
MKVIVVEDNDTMRLGLTEILRRAGYTVFDFADGPEALKYLQSNTAEILITDLRMAPLNGLEVLEKSRQIQPDIEVLLISAYGTIEDAVKAMKLGAVDFLTKPFPKEELVLRVEKIAQKITQQRQIEVLRAQNEYLQQELSYQYQSMVGRSEVMREIFRLIETVAAEDSSVLIEGESGTGKELVARAIHEKSPRKSMPFIRVNCGALNDNLLESELFGHEKGAFSGAIRQRKGRFELADGGTLFLDEIGDISPAMQIKLLRVLQEHEFERVGGEATIKVDVRIIAATNKNPEKLIARGEFREDLYYRLSVIPIKIPPLRQRKEDIELLVNHFLKKLNQKRGLQKRIDERGLNLLKLYSWPGNIRELENLIERLHIISKEEIIPVELIAAQLGGVGAHHNDWEGLPLDKALYNFEKSLIIQALKKADGVKNRAARLLGIRTSALYYKLEKFGLLK